VFPYPDVVTAIVIWHPGAPMGDDQPCSGWVREASPSVPRSSRMQLSRILRSSCWSDLTTPSCSLIGSSQCWRRLEIYTHTHTHTSKNEFCNILSPTKAPYNRNTGHVCLVWCTINYTKTFWQCVCVCALALSMHAFVSCSSL